MIALARREDESGHLARLCKQQILSSVPPPFFLITVNEIINSKLESAS